MRSAYDYMTANFGEAPLYVRLPGFVFWEDAYGLEKGYADRIRDYFANRHTPQRVGYHPTCVDSLHRCIRGDVRCLRTVRALIAEYEAGQVKV